MLNTGNSQYTEKVKMKGELSCPPLILSVSLSPRLSSSTFPLPYRFVTTKLISTVSAGKPWVTIFRGLVDGFHAISWGGFSKS